MDGETRRAIIREDIPVLSLQHIAEHQDIEQSPTSGEEQASRV